MAAIDFPVPSVVGETFTDPTTNVTYICVVLGPPAEWTTEGTSLGPASLTEAATGVITDKYSSPQTAVPKSSSGMTGSAIIPSGTTAQRPGSPATGAQRLNITNGFEEVYTGATTGWRELAWRVQQDEAQLTDLIPADGSTLPAVGQYRNITITAGYTVYCPPICQLSATGTIQIDGVIQGEANGLVGANGRTAFGLSVVAGQTTRASTAGIAQQGLGTAGRAYGFAILLSTGGASATTASWNSDCKGGDGGNAGACLVFRADGPINIGSGGTINCAGSDAGSFTMYSTQQGSTADWVSGGGGGGAGGLIYLESVQEIDINAAAELLNKGGDGGPGDISSTTLAQADGAGGGGGGSGGYIVLNSPNTQTNGASLVVTGGTGGTTAIKGSSIGGAYGGSFGGSGGAGALGATTASGSDGSAGQILYNVSMFV